MNISQATGAFESWFARHATIVREDLRLKHRLMRESPFVFLRGTFYRWIERWPAVCSDLRNAPRVCAVGDLHVENFGTWRDTEGRLIWGVNDVDEACVLPYTQDLVRLATSALMAIRSDHLIIGERAACDAIEEGYSAALECGGRPIVLAERRRWLRSIAISDLRDPAAYWAKLTALRPASGQLPASALRAALPDPKLPVRFVHRVAGVGSLGRRRIVAIGEWRGGWIAREAKARLPSAFVWAEGSGAPSRLNDARRLLKSAVRVPDPFFAIGPDWIVRRLAPDCSRIEMSELPAKRDERRLLRAMGWETANMHLGSPARPIRRDLSARKPRWLLDAAVRMADAVREDWREWCRTPA